MVPIHAALQQLLQRPPECGSLYEWFVEGRNDEAGYEQACQTLVVEWVKSVESVLALNEKIEELKIWRDTCRGGENTDYYVVVLEQILNRLYRQGLPVHHRDMPKSVAEDYNEAKAVFPFSSRSAAALLRLAIQKVCIELGEKGENLNDDIGKLVAKGLPAHIQQALDIVRVIGNNAVHPGELNVRDNPEIALSLFDLVNEVVEDRISKRDVIAAMYEALPLSRRKEIEKRDKGK